MKAKELAKYLLEHPEMDVWISPDVQVGEGGTRLRGVMTSLAIEADLDGDEIDDEYFYHPDIPYEITRNSEYEYSRQMDGLSKRIFLLF